MAKPSAPAPNLTVTEQGIPPCPRCGGASFSRAERGGKVIYCQKPGCWLLYGPAEDFEAMIRLWGGSGKAQTIPPKIGAALREILGRLNKGLEQVQA